MGVMFLRNDDFQLGNGRVFKIILASGYAAINSGAKKAAGASYAPDINVRVI